MKMKISVMGGTGNYKKIVYDERIIGANQIEVFINEVQKISGEEKENLAFNVDDNGEFFMVDSKYNCYEYPFDWFTNNKT